KLTRYVSLIGSTEVTAPLKLVLELALRVRILEHLYCIVVLKPWKWRGDLFQFRHISLKLRELSAPVLQHPMHDERDELFRQHHYVVQIGIRHFGLDHPKLCQMAPGLGLLRAKRWSETVDLAKGSRSRFVVELPRLRQVSLRVFKVIHLEQRGRAFT